MEGPAWDGSSTISRRATSASDRSFTLSSWIQVTDRTKTQPIIGKWDITGNGGAGLGWQLDHQQTGNLRFRSELHLIILDPGDGPDEDPAHHRQVGHHRQWRGRPGMAARPSADGQPPLQIGASPYHPGSR